MSPIQAKSLVNRFPLSWGDRSISSFILMALSVILIGVSAFKPDVFDFARSNLSDVAAPVLSLIRTPFEEVASFLNNVTGIAQLQAENVRLRQDNERLREWHHTALFLQSENKSLRKLLNLKADPEYKMVAARVLADSGNTYVKSMLVIAGKKDGVSKGDAVLSGDGLIGRIIEVGEKTSRVLLVTDMNSRVPVVVEDTQQHAILAGDNSRDLYLIHLPQDSEISKGVRIITSGYGGVYPVGIPVGRVEELEDGRLRVMLFSDFETVQVVRIIKKKEQLQ